MAHAAIAGLVGSGAVTWEHIERTTHWSVLLLFGGGLALGQVMDSTGASRMLAQGLGWRMQPHEEVSKACQPDGADQADRRLAGISFLSC